MDGSVVGYVILSVADMFSKFVAWMYTVHIGDLPITFGGLFTFTILFSFGMRLLFGVRGGSSIRGHLKNTKKETKQVKDTTIFIDNHYGGSGYPKNDNHGDSD